MSGAVVEADAALDPDALRAIVHGPKAAAWLVRRFRRSLRTFAAFRVEVPLGRERPRWFDLALAALRARPHVWRVVEVDRLGKGGSRVSVHWLAHPHAARRTRN